MTLDPRIAVLIPILLATGCVYVPANPPVRQSSSIGDGPDAPIRIGQASHEDVVARLGKPTYSTPDGSAWGYVFYVTTGKASGLLMGPCMPYVGTTDVFDPDDLWLEFDGQGILARCEKQLIRRTGTAFERAWHGSDPDRTWREFRETVAATTAPG